MEALSAGEGGGAADEALAHVRDIEETGARAHGHVLGDGAPVLDGQFKAGEVDESGAGARVSVKERGASRHGHVASIQLSKGGRHLQSGGLTGKGWMAPVALFPGGDRTTTTDPRAR